MPERIGYGCSLTLRWLNQAAELFREKLNERDYKDALQEYLSYEIESATRLRKTREILMNVWYYDCSEMGNFRQEGLDLMQRFPEYAALIHLCLIDIAYPVFADICGYMGKLFQYHDEITTLMLKQKLFDEWGRRGSLESVVRRVTLTLKELGFLTAKSRTRYITDKISVANDDLVNYMLATAMRIGTDSYYSLLELQQLSVLFPFDYHIKGDQLITDPRFAVANFNRNLNVILKDV